MSCHDASSHVVAVVVPHACMHAEYVTSIYAELRQLEKAALGATATYTTPRTLLSILRLAQALARLRFDSQVSQVRCGAPACQPRAT